MPAARLADEGLRIDWYSGLLTASTAKQLSLDPDAAALFLDEGRWPKVGAWTSTTERRLDQKQFARSLEQIADKGADAFYRGEVGRSLVRDVREKGGCLGEDDLASYRAEWVEPLALAYRGGHVYAAPGLTGGPTFAQALRALQESFTPGGRAPDADSYRAIALALDAAFKSRFEGMGDHESPAAPGCTTHFSVVDREGNMCAVTQTLLSIFGSRVVSPSTGILLNNGVMWFDPVPGKPNSLAPGKRCLANYCPVAGVAKDGTQFAFGASGGRKILGAVLQLSSFVMDHGMDLEAAFHQPRIDVSGTGQIVADRKLAGEIAGALARDMPVATVRRTVFPYAFACPAGVLRAQGMNSGCTEVMSPWGDAVHGG
jgi:gamma-glutamyltranspeptidase/glutathione hydrolase